MFNLTEMFSIAFSLFIVIDAIGNVPFYISFLKEIPPRRQTEIILREMLIALGVIIFFNFVGEALLSFLNIQKFTVEVAGGIVLFLLSLKMLFPSDVDTDKEMKKIKEPFIVPLAIPLIAGPAVLAMVMLYSHHGAWTMIGAITLSWLASLGILLMAPMFVKFLGEKGLIACERLMGFIMVLIAVQLFLTGVSHYIK
ncbi:MAG: antibiotic transporter [Chlamydiae bacterium]|nr:antibiotic transporter [Chlamydiota bacterium]